MYQLGNRNVQKQCQQTNIIGMAAVVGENFLNLPRLCYGGVREIAIEDVEVMD